MRKESKKEMRKESTKHTKKSNNGGNKEQKGTGHREKEQQKAEVRPSLAINLHVNTLNSPTNRQRLAEFIFLKL